MLFSELVTEVYTATNRPDMVAETAQQIIKATNQLHSMDFWPRDRRVDYYTFARPGFIQEMQISDTFQRLRAFSFIRKFNPAGVDPQTQLQSGLGRYPLIDIVDPQALFDEYYSNKVNVAYLSGDTLTIRSSDALKYILVGWYQLPLLLPTNTQFSSWIADLMPYAVIDRAVSGIFKMIGYDEQSRKYDQLNSENIQLMRTNFTTPEGF